MEVNKRPTVNAPLINSVHPSGAVEHESGQDRYRAAQRQEKPIITLNPDLSNDKGSLAKKD